AIALALAALGREPPRPGAADAAREALVPGSKLTLKSAVQVNRTRHFATLSIHQAVAAPLAADPAARFDVRPTLACRRHARA
ncbi:MAG: hypothetical protein M3P39_05930, partial [Actinomycetota bacterium]|nr:hypothetical protein [Actinomycetota bacterium]